MHQVRLDSGVQQRDPIIYYVCHIYHIYEEYSFQIFSMVDHHKMIVDYYQILNMVPGPLSVS